MKKKYEVSLWNCFSDEYCRFVWRVRNEKITRAMSIRDTNIIPFKHHKKWFKEHYIEYRIILVDGKKAGYLRVEKDKTISIALLKKYRNKGIGKEVLKRVKGNALIRIENKPSFYAFINTGYKLVGFYLEKK